MAAGDGLISMTPTSISYSGTSATINSDGGVDFSAITSLSLNGVFTSGYDNYLIVTNFISGGVGTIVYRMRASGVDNSTANSYTEERLAATSTTINGYRSTQTEASIFSAAASGGISGYQGYFYGPALAQPTASRSISIFGGTTSPTIYDFASTHNQSVSYDGITFTHNLSTWSGNIHVFGYEE